MQSFLKHDAFMKETEPFIRIIALVVGTIFGLCIFPLAVMAGASFLHVWQSITMRLALNIELPSMFDIAVAILMNIGLTSLFLLAVGGLLASIRLPRRRSWARRYIVVSLYVSIGLLVAFYIGICVLFVGFEFPQFGSSRVPFPYWGSASILTLFVICYSICMAWFIKVLNRLHHGGAFVDGW